MRLIADTRFGCSYSRMETTPSDRIIEQRVRNRIIEAVKTLAKGEAGVRSVSAVEYFEKFYDWIPYGGALPMASALTPAERERLTELSRLLDQACDATPETMTADELIATGWPRRIQLSAQEVLMLMERRGRFREDREEEHPFSPPP